MAFYPPGSAYDIERVVCHWSVRWKTIPSSRLVCIAACFGRLPPSPPVMLVRCVKSREIKRQPSGLERIKRVSRRKIQVNTAIKMYTHVSGRAPPTGPKFPNRRGLLATGLLL